MNLPLEIPRRLRKLGIPLLGSDLGGVAWRRTDALAVIESLSATKIAIPAGDIYRMEPWGIVPARANWSCDHVPGETATEYAERTRLVARVKIEDYPEEDAGKVLFALSFSSQQDAA